MEGNTTSASCTVSRSSWAQVYRSARCSNQMQLAQGQDLHLWWSSPAATMVYCNLHVSRSCDPSKVLTCRRVNLIWCHIWYAVTVQFKQVALYCTPCVTTSPVTQSTFRSRVSTCKCTNRLQLCIAYSIGKMKLSKSIYAELICLKSNCRTFWLCRSLSAACKRPVRLYVM